MQYEQMPRSPRTSCDRGNARFVSTRIRSARVLPSRSSHVERSCDGGRTDGLRRADGLHCRRRNCIPGRSTELCIPGRQPADAQWNFRCRLVVVATSASRDVATRSAKSGRRTPRCARSRTLRGSIRGTWVRPPFPPEPAGDRFVVRRIRRIIVDETSEASRTPARCHSIECRLFSDRGRWRFDNRLSS